MDEVGIDSGYLSLMTCASTFLFKKKRTYSTSKISFSK
uniref:Uncharacterized protein n=1 Tax=Arundo donax TaxID=35708 RepID=A0A0A9F8G9_ARUDO